jgi:inorganic pyrophosphatase
VTGKLSYDPDLEVFTVTRALAVGITYPFDWGFIPGTIAEDGDPLDALASALRR